MLLSHCRLVSLEPMELGHGNKGETWSPEFGQGNEELLRAGAVAKRKLRGRGKIGNHSSGLNRYFRGILKFKFC